MALAGNGAQSRSEQHSGAYQECASHNSAEAAAEMRRFADRLAGTLGLVR